MSILVSINCTTYNHEAYIADAIDSFLMQKTNFKFEILIGEDCSTDCTRNIVENYSKRYPGMIKIITSNENVGGRENMVRLKENSKGKYIAICEGDDYWTDPFKLQKQVDLMERNQEFSLCVHATNIVTVDKKLTGNVVKPYNETRITPTEDIILSDGSFFATNSILYRKELLNNPPEFFMNAHVGDYPLVLILSSRGRVFYIDEVMSSYRTGVKGSWTERTFSGEDRSYKFVKNYENDIWLLNEFNKYTNYIYNDLIKNAVSKRKGWIMFEIKKYLEKLKNL
ncbi:glycosyltransferase [Bacillus sp. AFS040349]|uniref:glycosyltransferase n=1 Tax=Bacillus sp. AFS040349 TaxID=2033502 RepID=UPI000BFCBB88|nr:glycosyltransferase [Bacillus sp. AFS040349]PGT81118.1 hypothetical protein COD11_18870 [Bacillus sp. AFS040349]